VHDVVSGVAYGAMLAAPLVLARRFRGDPDWAVVSRPVLLLALGSAVTLVVFASRVVEPWNGVVQRIAVTLALGAEALTAARMLPGAGRGRRNLAGFEPRQHEPGSTSGRRQKGWAWLARR
jgi:hypothetical protein